MASRSISKALRTDRENGYNPGLVRTPRNAAAILKLQGLDDYVFMRPMPPRSASPILLVAGPDGTRCSPTGSPTAITMRLRPPPYDPDRDTERDHPQSMMDFYGADDHGGGATKETSARSGRSNRGAPATLLYSTPRRTLMKCADP